MVVIYYILRGNHDSVKTLHNLTASGEGRYSYHVSYIVLVE